MGCRVVIIEPNRVAYDVEDFDCSLANLQQFVGGSIQDVFISPSASIICNEDGKLLNLPISRFLERDGRIVDALVGRCLIVGVNHDTGDYQSLSPQETLKYVNDYSRLQVQI